MLLHRSHILHYATSNTRQQSLRLLASPHPIARPTYFNESLHVRTLAALPEPFDSVLTTTTVVSSCIAIFATFSMKPSKESKGGQGDEDGFEWGLAGVVSCIPIFGFVAWVLPAITAGPSNPSSTSATAPSPASLYYAYSALYALPVLRSGFDFDSYSFLMLVLCVAHVQVERIVNTEPELLDTLKPLSAASTLSRQAMEGAFKFGSSVQATTEARTPAQLGAERQLSTEELEMEQFDTLLRRREDEKAGKAENKSLKPPE